MYTTTKLKLLIALNSCLAQWQELCEEDTPQEHKKVMFVIERFFLPRRVKKITNSCFSSTTFFVITFHYAPNRILVKSGQLLSKKKTY